MKIRTLVAATSAALFSLGAIAAGEKEQQQSQSGQSSKQSQSAAAGASAGQAFDQQTVRQVQQKLKDEGHEVGQIDGIMGPKTQAALKEYQKQEGMDASGQLDQETLSSLGVEAGASSAVGGTSSGTSGGASSGGAASGAGSSGSSGGSSYGGSQSQQKQ